MGGVIVSALGTGANFAIGASTFVVSAFFVLNLFRFPKLKPGHVSEKPKTPIDERSPILNPQVSTNSPLDSESVTQTEIPAPYVTSDTGLIRGAWEQVTTFIIGVKYVCKRPYILSLVFIKALSALLWGAQDLLNVKLCFEVFINDGQVCENCVFSNH
jgi:hypothetical protein